jgi:hypothetical protein
MQFQVREAGNDALVPSFYARQTRGYSSEPKPLVEYGALIALYHVLFIGLARSARRSGRLPAGYRLSDFMLVAAATHKLSRLIAKDRVTSALRAPFTSFDENAGHGEVEESARGDGIQKAVGELLTCPYCLGLWVASALTLGLARAPRATRLVSFTLSTLTIADVLQMAYKALEDASSA